MAHRLINSVRKADTITKSGLFLGNVNNWIQPKRTEMGPFSSKLGAHPPPNPRKLFSKPFSLKDGNNSAAHTSASDGIEADSKPSLFSGGGDGREGNEKKSSGGSRSDGKYQRQIFFALGCAGILGVPLQEITNDDNENPTVPADLARLVHIANSTDPQIQYEAVKSLRELLSEDNPPIDPLIRCKILPALVNCLRSHNPALESEAAAALAMIAAGTSEQTQAVVEAGAVPHLLKLLASPDPNVCQQAVWALGNIIGDGPKLRDYVINLGVVAPLLNLIQPDIPLALLRQVAWVIGNICSDTGPPISTLWEILPFLNVLMRHNDTEVLGDTVWGLSYLTDDAGKEQIQMVIESGVLPKLVQLLSHRELNVQKAALRAVGNIITANGDQAQTVLNCMVLSNFHSLLNHPKDKMCKDALRVLSNLTADNSTQVQAVIDAGLTPLIIDHLEIGRFKTQKEAARAVSNMAIRGNEKQVTYLINCGVVTPFCKLLICKDSQVIQVVLRGIENILKVSVNQDAEGKFRALVEDCGGLGKIESLQNHGNKEIRKIACNIMQNYFSDDVEEDAYLASEAAEDVIPSGPIKYDNRYICM